MTNLCFYLFNTFFFINIIPIPINANDTNPTEINIIKFLFSPVFGVTITVSETESSGSFSPVPGI